MGLKRSKTFAGISSHKSAVACKTENCAISSIKAQPRRLLYVCLLSLSKGAYIERHHYSFTSFRDTLNPHYRSASVDLHSFAKVLIEVGWLKFVMWYLCSHLQKVEMPHHQSRIAFAVVCKTFRRTITQIIGPCVCFAIVCKREHPLPMHLENHSLRLRPGLIYRVLDFS